MDILNTELDVPTRYMELNDGKICATVHRNWLANLWNVGPIQFLTHNSLSMDEIAARPSLDDLGPGWMRIYVKVYEKQSRNAIPLPRDRHSTSAKVQPELTFAQLLRYVAETNYRNLWKESYKKYYSLWNSSEQKEQSYAIPSSSDVAVMREVLSRMYGCSLIKIRKGQVIAVNPRTISHTHCNLLPALLAVESPLAFMTFHEQTAQYSLQECVMYSPAALSTSFSKPLFLVYQLLRLSRDLYDQGLALGEITLGDILLMDNFTIQVMPKLSDNIYSKSESDSDDPPISQESKLSPVQQDHTKKFASLSKLGVAHGSPDFGRYESIEKLCELWLHGHITNFDYLTALNNLAGRRYGDPSCHHVMPWVTDFSSRCGRNWRDLTKSKFRLNKGDRQLDLTFDSQNIDVGHHVSDVLSEITYYVYLSRRYTKSVLCKHVRSHWVPWEYPVSIQRLHEWSPDECIPQFFTDPSVFKSIHEDLPDLETPGWARSPEDFIEKHREALESLYVSERLHHWIDLTFGYKLSGVAAIKSKNVCLQLADNHTSLTSSGVVQLFTQPHPQKMVPSPYWSKMPPRLRNSVSNPKITKNDRSGERISEDEGQSSGIEEEESPVTTLVARSSPLALSRLLSRSRGSLLAVEDSSNKPEKPTAQTIILPKDYNPVAALLQVETTHAFMNKVSHRIYKPEIVHHGGIANYKQIVASGRIKEQQILGCLIVEIFLAGKFRATWNTGRVSFASRLETCVNALRVSPDALPRCVRNAVALLLQIDVIPKSYNINNDLSESSKTFNGTFRYPMVTSMGLPPPSAHQFLQPLLSGSLYPSSRYFQYLFNLVEMLQEYNELVRELNNALQDDDESDATSKTRIRYLCKISECKVKAVARELERLLPQAGSAMETSLQLIVSHVRQIMDEPYSAVLAAWHLFDPIAKALGPKDTANIFLGSILRLYENGSVMDSLNHTDVLPPGSLAKYRTMRLYHRSFLLKLMVRLGLRRFLDNFVTPLVEAVGGYRDYLQGASSANPHRGGNLKTCDLSGSSGDGEAILSPLDEDSSVDSENNCSSTCEQPTEECSKNIAMIVDSEVEEVFSMETEESPSPSDANRIPSIDIHELSLNLVEDLAEETTRNSPPGSVRSPTIPIPRRSDGAVTKSVIDFNSIGCHVGSKTSSEDMPLVSSYAVSGCPQDHETPKRLVIRGEADDKSDNDVDDENLQADQRKSSPSECKVSEMSAESVIWLSHRLGPVLTARHLSRNLLRMLTLCYAGRSNLTPASDDGEWKKTTTLAGDRNAVKVLECLTAIASLYGEQIILLQYLAHMTELLTLCKRKLTPNLEGGLVSCLALLIHIAPCLSDAFLMEALQETIVKSILHPTVRVLSTTRYNFPNGATARSALADKYLEAIFTISLRLGSSMTRSHLAVPIQRFFLAFDKAFGSNRSQNRDGDETQRAGLAMSRNDRSTAKIFMAQEESNLNDSQDWTLVDTSGCGSQLLSSVNNEVAISYSPPIIETDDMGNPQRNKAFEELKEVFTARFAHRAYLLFYRHVDEGVMEEILKNHQLVRDLCHEYERETDSNEVSSQTSALYAKHEDSTDAESSSKVVGSFGNISVIGNRIEVQTETSSVRPQGAANSEESSAREASASSSSSAGRQLRGNWLAYWEHEIGRPDKDSTFNMKQIKLQSFGGHTNSIRCIYSLDNENSFMSGARDKTVKLWSLRSQGDGSTVSSCQYTYTGHKKSILALTFLESLRYAVTCDSAVHCWDPFMGSLLGCPESSRPAPVNALAASPAPSTSLLVATTDITLRVIDCRTFQYVNEMKVSMNPTGLIRCIAVAPSGNWVVLGQASGFLTILDIRTGLIIASWKGHECEILQLEAVNETTIVSSSLDQTIAVWSAVDGKLKFHLKGATEPVHCMAVYEQQLITCTTANRIGVHTAVDSTATFSSSKLRSDAFKGVITAMAVLPLNRLLLLGADNGGISLLC